MKILFINPYPYHKTSNNKTKILSFEEMWHRIRRKATDQNVLFKFVSEYDVRKIIRSPSSKEAAGIDELPAQYIKKIAFKLVKPLTWLINKSIWPNTFPEQMKQTDIKSLF